MNYFKEHDYTKTEIKEIQKVICERLEEYQSKTNKREETEPRAEEPPDDFFVHMFKKTKANRKPKEFQKYMQY